MDPIRHENMEPQLFMNLLVCQISIMRSFGAKKRAYKSAKLIKNKGEIVRPSCHKNKHYELETHVEVVYL